MFLIWRFMIQPPPKSVGIMDKATVKASKNVKIESKIDIVKNDATHSSLMLAEFILNLYFKNVLEHFTDSLS